MRKKEKELTADEERLIMSVHVALVELIKLSKTHGREAAETHLYMMKLDLLAIEDRYGIK